MIRNIYHFNANKSINKFMQLNDKQHADNKWLNYSSESLYQAASLVI